MKLNNSLTIVTFYSHNDSMSDTHMPPNKGVGDAALVSFVSNVEKDLLAEIMIRLKEKKLTMEEAQKLAQDFLAVLPVQDKVELLQKLQDLSTNYNEARAVYLKHASPLYEENRKKKLELMHHYIKKGNIDAALAVAKGGV